MMWITRVLELLSKIAVAGALFDLEHWGANIMKICKKKCTAGNDDESIVCWGCGHRFDAASIQTTLDIYSHVASGLQQAAANNFDDVIFNKQKGTFVKSD